MSRGPGGPRALSELTGPDADGRGALGRPPGRRAGRSPGAAPPGCTGGDLVPPRGLRPRRTRRGAGTDRRVGRRGARVRALAVRGPPDGVVEPGASAGARTRSRHRLGLALGVSTAALAHVWGPRALSALAAEVTAATADLPWRGGLALSGDAGTLRGVSGPSGERGELWAVLGAGPDTPPTLLRAAGVSLDPDGRLALRRRPPLGARGARASWARSRCPESCPSASRGRSGHRTRSPVMGSILGSRWLAGASTAGSASPRSRPCWRCSARCWAGRSVARRPSSGALPRWDWPTGACVSVRWGFAPANSIR
jgi:hypothetical protein